MKKSVCVLAAAFLLVFGANSFACVGKTLIIGALDTPNERLLAQMMAVIINERTGTTVNVEYFEDQSKLYQAVENKEINILTGNTGRALQLLGKQSGEDADSIYALVKQEYENRFQLVLLEPFGPSPANPGEKLYVDVPMVASGILVDYPALPRVINKLAGIAGERNYAKLLASVEAGDKPSQVARDFLKRKRFI